ncbi:helix-turn-helix domain-containing protein [Metabacillus fastidiosus]|uniref:TetR/AcrR family transcriptional regulator n=1 Tax=Metabacillus fastidiosus TaxID=1458 RepID=UPI002E1ED189|nr:helix-turn-helix domain containing protein [Metabacillus fastidiosus]
MDEKKKQILFAAMKLFSTQGYQQTTMQEIANVCGVSKGSLYVSFKSKEELLLNILQYNTQLIDDERALIERETDLDAKEKFTQCLELSIRHDLEFYEFYKLGDMSDSGDGKIVDYLSERFLKNMEWMKGNLIRIYGPKLEPYTKDCFIILKGIGSEYMNLIIKKVIKIDVKQLAYFLIKQIDHIVEGMLQGKYKPLVSNELSAYLDVRIEKQHPLVIIKQMEDELEVLQLEKSIKEEAAQSINILANELRELEPRKAILNGMLRNLEEVTALTHLRLRLLSVLHSENSK